MALLPEPEFTIVQAAAQHEALLQAVRSGSGDVHLDLGAVSDFDSSGVQLLVALRHSLVAGGRGLVLDGASERVRDALATFGLAELFPIAGASRP